ncbi:hypothetical protein C8A00DRAFT_15579 [Chaetomidium leptoderma]|uniref:Uncharacterized protein n=1 Tax=Chaetomidium leptoderma TaxID=669021 RepID=A0AAN6ZWY7_9PEZI|nr:hypothetical protein C8A00DRAFT_15579 [Chaetomidium leptoderma]
MNSSRSSQRRSPGVDPGALPPAPPNVPPRSMSPAVGVGTNRPVAPRTSTSSRSIQPTSASGSGSRNDGTRRANVNPSSTAGFMHHQFRPTRVSRPAGVPPRSLPPLISHPCYRRFPALVFFQLSPL